MSIIRPFDPKGRRPVRFDEASVIEEFPMSRNRHLSRAAVFLGFVLLVPYRTFGGIPVDANNPPNVLLILIDDLGWMDLACQGNSNLSTPRIDAFASQGMRFTNAYAAAPVCSPTRAAILTGMSPARLHLTNHLPHQDRFTPEDSKLNPAEMVDHLPGDSTQQMRVRALEELQEDAPGVAVLSGGKFDGLEDALVEALQPVLHDEVSDALRDGID